MRRLEEALRQYKHNHGRGGFVFAYDKYTVDAIFADLRKIVELMELAEEANKTPSTDSNPLTKMVDDTIRTTRRTEAKFWRKELDKLLEGE